MALYRLQRSRPDGDEVPEEIPHSEAQQVEVLGEREVFGEFKAYIKGGGFMRDGGFHMTLNIAFEDVDNALPLMKMPGVTFTFTASRKRRGQVYEDPWATEEGNGDG